MKRVLAVLAITIAAIAGSAVPASAAASTLCTGHTTVGSLKYAVNVRPSTDPTHTGTQLAVCVHVVGENVGGGTLVSAYYAEGSYYPGGWLVTLSEMHTDCIGSYGCGTSAILQVAAVPGACSGTYPMIYIGWGTIEEYVCPLGG